MSTYAVVKNYTPENGLSATFRQWRADSHCKYMHGYALGVEVCFLCEGSQLDENGWVVNFGGLKGFKQYLADTFDHKTLAASDDPYIDTFRDLNKQGLIQLVEVKRTGCEGFAKMIATHLVTNVMETLVGAATRDVILSYVKVYEHNGNSAIYYPKTLGDS